MRKVSIIVGIILVCMGMYISVGFFPILGVKATVAGATTAFGGGWIIGCNI